MSLLEQFENELHPLLQGDGRVHGSLERCASWRKAAAGITELADRGGLRRLVVAPRAELDEVHAVLSESLGAARVERDRAGRTAREYEDFDAGIGGADVLVAESASIGLLTPGEESPALSLLPQTHIVVVPASRLVERLQDGLEVLREDGGRRSRSLTFITGPSRTADIEKILVLPAHGPAELHVFVIEGI